MKFLISFLIIQEITSGLDPLGMSDTVKTFQKESGNIASNMPPILPMQNTVI